MIKPIFQGETAVIAGTGPSVTQEVMDLCNWAREAGKIRIFGANLAYRGFDVDVLHGCNWQFWDHYWNIDLKGTPFDKWTTRPELEGKYDGLNYIREEWIDGLSTDPAYIAAHHGTGPQVVNLALHYGIRRMLLVGWDMRFPGKVSNNHYTEKRHFFGEYAKPLQHWPRTGQEGQLEGLIREMETINPADYGIEIFNCTPGSALLHFPFRNLEEML